MLNELKVEYPHEKAQQVIESIGARQKESVTQEDFYLTSESGRAYKLVRRQGNTYLIGLVENNGQFEQLVYETLDESVAREVSALFEGSSYVIRKERTFYELDGSDIVLDRVSGLGEFVELYPKDENAEKELLKQFGVSTEYLITESYYDLF